MKKKVKKKNWNKILKKLYERYPERDIEIKDWNKGGFYKEDKYKQPVKHKLY